MKKNRTITIAYRASQSINVIGLIPDGQLSCCWVWGKGGWVVQKVVVWRGSILEGIRNFRVFLSQRFFYYFLWKFHSVWKKKNQKKKSHKNLVSSFRDFFNLFSTLHVVLRNGNSNCRDGCINLSNHLSGGDEILNAWETETVSSGTTVEYQGLSGLIKVLLR